MYQQANLTLLSQRCSGKAVSSYLDCKGSIPMCGCSKVFKHHFILFFKL